MHKRTRRMLLWSWVNSAAGLAPGRPAMAANYALHAFARLELHFLGTLLSARNA